VVIRNLRIVKAGVFFPMPDIKSLDKSLGSRHRAALGITEETDAVVVVVSEERGTISFCFNGNIVSNLDGASLRQALLGLFGQRTQKKKKPAPGKRSNQHTGSHRISVIPQASTGASSGAATGNTGSVMLSPPQSTASPPSGMSTPGGMTPPSGLPTLSGLAPPSAREGVSPSSPPNPPRGRPLAPAKVDTPKPMSAVEPPESTSESTREPPENR
jgi:diadenylate cyclase